MPPPRPPPVLLCRAGMGSGTRARARARPLTSGVHSQEGEASHVGSVARESLDFEWAVKGQEGVGGGEGRRTCREGRVACPCVHFWPLSRDVEASAEGGEADVEGVDVSLACGTCDACDACGDVCCDVGCGRCRAKVRRMEAEVHGDAKKWAGWSPCQVRRRTGREGRSLWVAAAGSVYDAGAVASWHPGGERALLLRGGGDATADMFFHPERAKAVWAACRLGPLLSPCKASRDPAADARLCHPPTDITEHAGSACTLM